MVAAYCATCVTQRREDDMVLVVFLGLMYLAYRVSERPSGADDEEE